MRKICVITTSRAEYGLLYWVMKGISDDPDLNLQLIVTGTHLSSEFGKTIDQIREDGFHVDRSFDLQLHDDRPQGISSSLSIAITSFATSLATLKPDLLIILGDRFEILGAAAAATIANIPVAHLHGGELTLGAIDDAIRHAVTKMSHLHFTSTETYRKRVIQMGEEPKRVFNVGGMGLDYLKKTKFLTASELEVALKTKWNKKNFLITFHPETLSEEEKSSHILPLLNVLQETEETNFYFTYPNADTGNKEIIEAIYGFEKLYPERVKIFKSMGQLNYLSMLKKADAVIGNSSSGIIEAPSFKIPTINVGKRQEGRIKADSVIDAENTEESIRTALEKAFSSRFKTKLKSCKNPYGNGGAADRVLKTIKHTDFNKLVFKRFYDLP